MALIDQRILIDAPPDAVWKIISDSNQLSRWHAGYKQVSVLTTLPTGVGVRRRCTPVQGKDIIEEVTAWVEGLGYEYRIVDGGPYKLFQARIRLQVNPDGTSVQWTVVYQPKGFGGMIKNRMGGKRRLSDLIAASLRALKREVDTMGIHMDENNRAKVSIQGRMNADQRAQYQRRHAPPEKEEAEAVAVPPLPDVSPAPVPSFVAMLGTDEPDVDGSHLIDTEPKAPKGLKEAIATQEHPPTPIAAPAEVPVADQPFVRPPDVIVPPALEPSHQTPPRGIPSIQEVQPPAIEEKRKTPTPDLPAAEILPPPTPKTDTGEMSIWEVFGIKRPSERDQAVLNEMVREVQTRRRSGMAMNGGFDRSVRVRRLPTTLGLRLRLAFEAVRVRLHRPHEDE